MHTCFICGADVEDTEGLQTPGVLPLCSDDLDNPCDKAFHRWNIAEDPLACDVAGVEA